MGQSIPGVVKIPDYEPNTDSVVIFQNCRYITEEFFYAFFHLLAQKLGFQISRESTGNAELLSQFKVQGKQSR